MGRNDQRLKADEQRPKHDMAAPGRANPPADAKASGRSDRARIRGFPPQHLSGMD